MKRKRTDEQLDNQIQGSALLLDAGKHLVKARGLTVLDLVGINVIKGSESDNPEFHALSLLTVLIARVNGVKPTDDWINIVCRKLGDTRMNQLTNGNELAALRRALDKSVFKGGPAVFGRSEKGAIERIVAVRYRKGEVHGQMLASGKWIRIVGWEVRP